MANEFVTPAALRSGASRVFVGPIALCILYVLYSLWMYWSKYFIFDTQVHLPNIYVTIDYQVRRGQC